MATTTKFAYASETTITCGLDGLGNGNGRASAAIDNTVNLYVDAIVQFKFQTTAGSLGTSPALFIYAYGWSQGQGSDYTDNVSGSDTNFTPAVASNLKILGAVSYNVSANAVLYAGPFSLALAFGGTLPGKWGIVVVNSTGLNLSGTAGQQVNNIATYIGLYLQNV